MDRPIWRMHISTHHCPAWICPECQSGHVTMEPNSLKYAQTVKSKNQQKESYSDIEWIELSFIAWGKCSNDLCSQEFAIAGIGGVEPQYTSAEGDWEYFEYFTPRIIQPMPNIIKIPEDCPEEISAPLKESFGLFLYDRASCAARIRTTLEAIMSYLNIPSSQVKGESTEYLSLHKRIEIYSKSEPNIGSHLMALKWLGNTGSHENTVKKTDILDAFEILEHCIEEIVGNRSERIKKLAEKIRNSHSKRST
ncbi:DUF4145 domain-containing protein [Chitiniphilus eburneus]|uniref:DUF4145 domain-containing protein n=1 Tax=Chitiniphilus eburneus TaxID=2571148 RepID=A0A4U0Q7J8_9NEIS|nr:DUF4145 domain-containing protein [Chitiniphilus eburneus]TJZ71704.1 DUF4145 domain-containing protein [Chitiniphilus eburneus]